MALRPFVDSFYFHYSDGDVQIQGPPPTKFGDLHDYAFDLDL